MRFVQAVLILMSVGPAAAEIAIERKVNTPKEDLIQHQEKSEKMSLNKCKNPLFQVLTLI
jgi:hypothetical protein